MKKESFSFLIIGRISKVVLEMPNVATGQIGGEKKSAFLRPGLVEKVKKYYNK